MLLSATHLRTLLYDTAAGGRMDMPRTMLPPDSPQLDDLFARCLPVGDVLTITGAAVDTATVSGTTSLPAYPAPMPTTLAFQQDPQGNATGFTLRVYLPSAERLTCGRIRLDLGPLPQTIGASDPALAIIVSPDGADTADRFGYEVLGELTHTALDTTFTVRPSHDGLYAQEITSPYTKALADLADLRQIAIPGTDLRADLPEATVQALISVAGPLHGLQVTELGLSLTPDTCTPSAAWLRILTSNQISEPVTGITLKDTHLTVALPIIADAQAGAQLTGNCQVQGVDFTGLLSLPGLQLQAQTRIPLAGNTELAEHLDGTGLPADTTATIMLEAALAEKHYTLACALESEPVTLLDGLQLTEPSLLVTRSGTQTAISLQAALTVKDTLTLELQARKTGSHWLFQADTSGEDLSVKQIFDWFAGGLPAWLEDLAISGMSAQVERSGATTTGTLTLHTTATLADVPVDTVITITLATTKAAEIRFIVALPARTGCRTMVFELHAESGAGAQFAAIWHAD
ncbi:hypothetical protein QZH56_00515 [Streptomyces olivoreticuli]|uniref:hypothetical protein n=1 Tax=Streptomyces olivoreticuli TaxID=68246 RepID=UPI002659946B|nr:hypothetical protein [Streptomyces olivoreticuli]WKK24212.1 hypothetical protein QZH56_00515 [Streptomyces olivoreticuli]